MTIILQVMDFSNCASSKRYIAIPFHNILTDKKIQQTLKHVQVHDT